MPVQTRRGAPKTGVFAANEQIADQQEEIDELWAAQKETGSAICDLRKRLCMVEGGDNRTRYRLYLLWLAITVSAVVCAAAPSLTHP